MTDHGQLVETYFGYRLYWREWSESPDGYTLVGTWTAVPEAGDNIEGRTITNIVVIPAPGRGVFGRPDPDGQKAYELSNLKALVDRATGRAAGIKTSFEVGRGKFTEGGDVVKDGEPAREEWPPKETKA